MIDFPNSPTNGQVFTSVNTSWIFDGSKWVAGNNPAAFLPLTGGTLSGALVLTVPLAITSGGTGATTAAGGPWLLRSTGGVLSGPLGVNTAIPAGGTLGTIYGLTISLDNGLAWNLYLNAAGSAWLRKSGTGFGGVIGYDTTVGAFSWYTAPAGAVDSSAAITGRMFLDITGKLTLTNRLIVSYADDASMQAFIGGTSTGLRIRTVAGGVFVEGVDQTGNASYQPLLLGGNPTVSVQINGILNTVFTTSALTQFGALYVGSTYPVSTSGSGYCHIQSGTTANSGFFASHNHAGVRVFYLGWDETRCALNVEIGGEFRVYGANIYADSGAVGSFGAGAIISFQARDISRTWGWYANGSDAFLYNGTDGNRMSVGNSGVAYFYNHVNPVTNNVFWCGTQPWAVSWYAVGSYNFVNASDVRLKTDITDLPNCLDVVNTLTPRRFRFNNDPEDQKWRLHWGFIAQEVGEVMDAAGYDFSGGHRIDVDDREGPTKGEEHHGLVYSNLTAVLWKAVQELSAEVQALREKVG